MSINGTPGKAWIIGSGLIGGSVGLALRAAGWHVTVSDRDSDVAAEAMSIGAADAVGDAPDADLTVIAVPVSDVAGAARRAFDAGAELVTDVGSTKGEVCRQIEDPRFVGGHPMAGSEQDGLAGARADLFNGATWVLTPTENTDQGRFATVRATVKSLGAEVLTIAPDVHDRLVAQVSHVPHLTAAALMILADDSSVQHRALLRLAAGGFRDMTRIAAGRTSIWPDICMSNRDAIVSGLDDLLAALADLRRAVDEGRPDDLVEVLGRARAARINLPTGFSTGKDLSELRVPIPDTPGQIAAIARLATELDVNIHDMELTHSGEGMQGVMIMVVDSDVAERLVGGLMAQGYRPGLRALS